MANGKMDWRLHAAALAVVLGVGSAPAALAQAARGVKAAEYYVYFTNGRVMRVLNTMDQGEWTSLVIDARNHLTVPKQTILQVERIAPEDKTVNVSSVNVMSEQPEPAYAAGGGVPPQVPFATPVASDREQPPPAPVDPRMEQMRSQVREQMDALRSNALFGEEHENAPPPSSTDSPQTLSGPRRPLR